MLSILRFLSQAVDAEEVDARVVVGDRERDVDEGVVAIGDSMLEGVLDHIDSEERRYHDSVGRSRRGERDLDLVGIADTHEVDIVLKEVDFGGERSESLIAFVEDVAHQF